MDKAEFRGKLQTIKNNYALVQTGILFLAQPDAVTKFDEYSLPFAEHPEAKKFLYIRYVLENDELLSLATNQLRKSVLRNCIKEMFELLKEYGLKTGQIKLLKASPWYQFLRMVRNSLSHDFFLRYRKYDLSLLPITWSGLTLTAAMDGSELSMAGFLTRVKTQELMDDVISFVEQHVS